MNPIARSIRQTPIKLWPQLLGLALVVYSGLLLAVVCVSNCADAQVNSYGEFTTGIPIKIPLFHGLEPKLTLSYHSNPANGWVGAGWTLNGGPSYIVRASQGRGAPRFDASDIFLLDGMELVPCASQSGSPSCTSAMHAFGSSAGFYSTKTENFERMRYDDGLVDTWTIWSKTGIQRVFVAQSKNLSGMTYRWALSSQKDTHENVVSYEYTRDTSTNEVYLSRIYYYIPPSPQIPIPRAQIIFYSSDRPDKVTYGVGESLGIIGRRLQAIDVLLSGNRVRTYLLNYHLSASTSNSLLDSVTVYGRDALVNCGSASGDPCDNSKPQGLVVAGTSLPPTTFQYDETATSTFQAAAATTIDIGNVSNAVISGDFNGDGKTDYLSVDSPSFNTHLSNGDGTFTVNNKTAIPQWCKFNMAGLCFDNVTSVVVGDFNGDGKTDFLLIADQLQVFLSNGDGTFSNVSSPPPDFCEGAPAYQCMAAPLPAPSLAPPTQYNPRRPRGLSPGEIITGDFNGDGRTDFVVARDKFYTFLSNGDGTFQVIATAPPSWCGNASGCLSKQPNHIIVGDFDGDGKTDFLSANGNFDIFRSNGDGTFAWIPIPPPSGASCTQGTNTSAALCLTSDQNAVIVGDFNGDGKTDFASAGTNNVFLSNGNGSLTLVAGATLPPLYAGSGPAQGSLSTDPQHVILGDFNGDGKTDFLSVNTYQGNTIFDIWISLGDGHFQHLTAPALCSLLSTPNLPNFISRVVGDFDGDGKTDFYSEGMCSARGGPADHLIRMSNGFGGTTAIFYTPSSKYPNTFLPVGAVYQTVAATTVSDGRGVSDTHTYSYAGGLWDSAQRRFLGFGTMTETIDTLGDYVQTTYLQTPGCFSQPSRSYLKDPQGRIYRFSVYSYVAQGSAPYQCQLSSRTDYQAELTCVDDDSCAQNARAIRTDFLYDDYGNLIKQTEHGDVKLTGDERTTTWSFIPNETAYIVTLPSRIDTYSGEVVPSTGGDLGQIALFYDWQASAAAPIKGDLTYRSDAIDSKSSAMTMFKYDTYGNLIATTDGNGHTSTTDFDPTYNLFPIKRCNALSWCTKYDWGDYVTGKLQSVTDPNGAITTYSYDLFGRPTQVKSPDGGTTQTAYEFTFDESGAPTGQTIRETAPDGTAKKEWTDGLGRTYRTVKAGGYEKDTEYSDATTNPSKESDWYLPPDTPQWWGYYYDGARRRTLMSYLGGPPYSVGTTYLVGSVQISDTPEGPGPSGGGRWRTIRGFNIDAYGRTSSVQEFNGHVTKTQYNYDLLGRLTRVTDALGNYSLTTWDMLGHKRSVSDPDMGAWTYSLDPVGNVLSQTDAKGQTIKFTYDALNRVSTKTYPDGSRAMWNYDECCRHGASTPRRQHHGWPWHRRLQIPDEEGSRRGRLPAFRRWRCGWRSRSQEGRQNPHAGGNSDG